MDVSVSLYQTEEIELRGFAGDLFIQKSLISTGSPPYLRLPVGHKDRTDQDQHVVHASGFSVDVTLSRKQLLELTDDGQLFATHVFHSFATSTQLHHFPSTRLRLSRSRRVWLGDYGKPYQNPNVYS